MVAATLATIHNQHFIVGLVDQMRESIEKGTFFEFKDAIYDQILQKVIWG